MSVDFARAVIAGLQHNGVEVRYPLGDRYLTNGNGQTSDYRGLSWHHTATAYSNTAPSVLWNGRPDLTGPLCNTAGLADGAVAMIAAHPANHAGASGGRSMGPLPTTRTFNRLMWGHEIVYPGDQPMTAAQYRTMQILGGVISGILDRPTAEWCRGHAETSITGKWDPGYAPGKTIDLAAARRDTWAALHSAPVTVPEGLFMALTDAQQLEILEAARSVLFGKANVRVAGEMAMAVYNLQRSLDSMALRVDELVKKPAGQVDTAPVVAAVVDAVTRAGIADKVLDGLAAALSSRPV